MNQLFIELPEKISVKIMQGSSGVFIAELSEYDAFTEANTLLELDNQINDLIFTIFDVPKEYQKAIRYLREPSKQELGLQEKMNFLKFINSEAQRVFK